MYSLYTTSHGFTISGRRGRAYPFEADQFPSDLWNPGDLQGQTVLVNGQSRRVYGVHSFRLAISESNPYRLAFGLLIDPLEGDEGLPS